MPSGSPPENDGFAARLAVFYAASIMALGIGMPLFPLWLRARGLDAQAIGVVLTVPLVVRTLAIPLAARAADRLNALRASLLVAALGGTLGYTIVAFAGGALAIIAGVALAAAFFTPILPLTDAYALKGLGTRGRAYGPVRLWGSVAYIIGNFAAGFAIDSLAPQALIWLIVASSALTAAAAISLAPLGPPLGTAALAEAAPAARLLRNPAFIAVIAAASLIQASHAVYYGFSTLAWIAGGFDGKAVAALWSLGVAAEIVLFALSARLPTWLTPLRLIMLGGAAGVLRWSVMALDPPAILLPALQCLHGLSFGATHLGALGLLARLAPSGLAARAQGYLALALGLVTAAATSVSGVFYAAYGEHAYAAMALAALAGGVCALAAQRFTREVVHAA